jgi:outer membrane biosynthesis protein TonB
MNPRPNIPNNIFLVLFFSCLLHLCLALVLSNASWLHVGQGNEKRDQAHSVRLKVVVADQKSAQGSSSRKPQALIKQNPPKRKRAPSTKAAAKPKSAPASALSSKNAGTKSGSTVAGASQVSGVEPVGATTGGRRSKVDLSRREPELISCTKPELTDGALDAGILGPFKLEVWVDEQGVAKQVDVPQKVGFGMDQRLVDAAKTCKFRPARYANGKPYATWGGVTIKVAGP